MKPSFTDHRFIHLDSNNVYIFETQGLKIMSGSKRIYLYWVLQIVGWFLYSFIAGILAVVVNKQNFNSHLAFGLFFIFIMGIFTSHLYRLVIKKYKWKRFKIGKVALLAILGSFIATLLFISMTLLISGDWEKLNLSSKPSLLEDFIGVWPVFLFWSALYFSFQYFDNYRKEEIKNLTLQAEKSQFELKRLKSQINPHFLFNAMNSIKALISEDPSKAKQAVNQLSHLLRISLSLSDQNKIRISEELKLLEDYIGLEKARYEDRLMFSKKIDPGAVQTYLPPMLLQTLAENAIKHGISKEVSGGKIELSIQKIKDQVQIELTSTGQLPLARENNKSRNKSKQREGVGLNNANSRMAYLYGENFEFQIFNLDPKHVKVSITIPAV